MSTVFNKSGLMLWESTVRKISHERHGKLRAEYNKRSCLKLELGERVRQGENEEKQPSFAPLLVDEWSRLGDNVDFPPGNKLFPKHGSKLCLSCLKNLSSGVVFVGAYAKRTYEHQGQNISLPKQR